MEGRTTGRADKSGQTANEQLGYLRLFKWPFRTPAQHWLEIRLKLPHGTCGGAGYLKSGKVPDWAGVTEIARCC
jgi:hypothetical protein